MSDGVTRDKCEGIETLYRMNYIRRVDMPSREEMYLILKNRSEEIQNKPCDWENYYD